jgi:hypothetical protein
MAITKCFIKSLKNVDLFGQTFNFTIKGGPFFTTTFGGLVSLLMTTVLLCCSIFYIDQLFRRSKYTFYSQNYESNNSPPINGNNLNFSLVFSMVNENGVKSYNESIFNFSLYQSTIYKDYATDTVSRYNISQVEIPLEQCKSLVNVYNTSQLNQRSLGVARCISNDFEGWTLNGTSDDVKISYLEFRLNKCTGSETCLSEKEISKFLSHTKLSFSFPSGYIVADDLHNPGRKYIQKDYFFADSATNRIITYYFKYLYLYSDENIIWEDYQPHIFTAMDWFTEQVTQKVEENSQLLILRIVPSTTIVKYFRQYIKLSTILVNIGGLLSSMIVVSNFLAAYVNSIKMKMFIMNRLYDFVEDEAEFNQLKRRVGIFNHIKTSNNPNKPNDPSNDISNDIMYEEDNTKRNMNYIEEKHLNIEPGSHLDHVGKVTNIFQNQTNNYTTIINSSNSCPIIINNKVADNINNTADLSQGNINSPVAISPNTTSLSQTQRRLSLPYTKFLNKTPLTTFTNNEQNKSQSEDVPGVYDKHQLYLQEVNIKKHISQLIEYENRRNKKFILSYLDLFYVTVCSMKGSQMKSKHKFRKARMYSKAEDSINRQFDVVEVFKGLHKLNSFIKFFMDEKQYDLFYYEEREKIYFNQLTPFSKETQLKHLLKAYNSYKEVRNHSSDDILNQILLQKLDHKIREVFDSIETRVLTKNVEN